MEEQMALETYLRAMVNEHDECSIKWHVRLYVS